MLLEKNQEPIFKTCKVCGGPFKKSDLIYYCPVCRKAYHHSHLKGIKGRKKCFFCGRLLYHKKPISIFCDICEVPFGKNDRVYFCPACGNAYHHFHSRGIRGRSECVFCGKYYRFGKTKRYWVIINLGYILTR